MEAARRASIADEKERQIRVVESAAGHLAPEIWRPLEAQHILMLMMRTQVRVSRLHK